MKCWNKHNKDEETRLNESMYNSKNTSSEKPSQAESRRLERMKCWNKHNKDEETRLNESMFNSEETSSGKPWQKKGRRLQSMIQSCDMYQYLIPEINIKINTYYILILWPLYKHRFVRNLFFLHSFTWDYILEQFSTAFSFLWLSE